MRVNDAPTSLHVVVVDDEFFIAWHIQAIIEELGIRNCDIVNTARGALERVLSGKTDLVLMDVNLGEGADGVDTVRQILEQRDVAVIFITAYNDEDNVNRMRQVKPDAPILSKPVSAEELRSAVMEIFGGS